MSNQLLYSDGLVEAHNAEREMFGFPRLEALLKEESKAVPLIDYLLRELAAFTGPAWEQEDDVTLVTLQRAQDTESIAGVWSDVAEDLSGSPARDSSEDT